MTDFVKENNVSFPVVLANEANNDGVLHVFMDEASLASCSGDPTIFEKRVKQICKDKDYVLSRTMT